MQVPGIATVSHHARVATTLAPGRPALWLGLRTAAAVALPLAIAPWLHPLAATWAPIAAFGIALVDKGGAYRSRAKAMGSVALGGIAAVTIGTIASGNPALAIAAVTITATLCAFGQAFPPAGPAIGNTIAIHMIIAAFLPPYLGALRGALLGYAGGAAWALLLGLVVWPVRVYKPLRRAVSATLGGLADYTSSLAARSNRDELTRAHRKIRDQLEVARRTLVTTRRGRSRESGRGERLLAIVHAADHMFGILVAIEEILDAGLPDATTAAVVRGLEVDAGALRQLADAVLVEEAMTIPAPPFDPAATVPETDGESRQAALLLSRISTERARVASLIESLATDAEPVTDIFRLVEHAPSFLDVIRANLNVDSAVLRHAFRVGVCVLGASTIASLYEIDHGYWIALTTYLLLQPNRSATTTRAIQRGVGTVAGALFAAAVAWTIRDPLVLTILIIALAGTSASVLQLNYALFALFVTPTFVLLAEIHTHDLLLIEIRVAYTLLAGTLAFLASIALWPARERIQFDEQMARALEALERYLGAVSTAVAAGAPAPSIDVVEARRAYGMAINNAETALDRVMAERQPSAVIEPRMTMVQLTRRLSIAINVFGTTRNVVEIHPYRPAVSAFSSATRGRLAELIGALRTGQPPGPWRPSAPQIGNDTIMARRVRVERYLVLLGEAVTRATSQR